VGVVAIKTKKRGQLKDVFPQRLKPALKMPHVSQRWTAAPPKIKTAAPP